MLDVERLHKRVGDFALRDISLHVDRGEFFVLLGPTGSGKTLLLELIAGFMTPDFGRVLIAGEDATLLPPEDRNIGVVYQDHMLFPHRDARQNINYGMKMRHVPRKEADERIAELADTLHLRHLLDRPVTALSGGEKQRVALARALAPRPQLLLLDEPFSSLDPPVREKLRKEVAELHERLSFTTLMVTHRRAEAQALGERVAVMSAGTIRQVGPAEDIFDRPDSTFVAQFTGGTNILRGTATAGEELTTFRCGNLELVSTTEATGHCRALVRPENIIVARHHTESSARNELQGEMENIERHGNTCRVTARFNGESLVAIVTPQSARELGLEPGTTVQFFFKAHNLHLFPDDEEDEASP